MKHLPEGIDFDINRVGLHPEPADPVPPVVAASRARASARETKPRRVATKRTTTTGSAEDDPPVEPEFLTVEEAAERLRCDRKTVYAAIVRGDLPALRLGRVVRIPWAVVTSNLESKSASRRRRKA